jgi:thiol-disulfide isomerase/thioredoxin
MPSIQVQMISAPWCKRCALMKPDILRTVNMVNAGFTYLNFDELEEDDEAKLAVTALPTVRMRVDDGDWKAYPAGEISVWKEAILALAPVAPTEDDDF